MDNVILKGESIHKWFGAVQALKGVDFEVIEGEILGLVGGNGAGKSTLIKILSGVYQKDEGKIFLREEEVNFANPREARKAGIETVYQDQALIEDLNVAQNIFLTRELTKSFGVVDNNRMIEESASLVKTLGLSISSMKKEVQFCSGGERQGIALSRAIYFKAKLVLLDEPTTALSYEGRKKVFNLIQRMRDEEGISFVIISHDIERVYSLCDRFLIFNRGEKKTEVPKAGITIEEMEELML
jgi:simple sugar transport system ATP-binding protein